MSIAKFLIFIFGLAVGSFLNVLADRLPREETVIKGRSHCEKCKKNLKWCDLIPLLSFIFLKGKCRYCKTHLSFYYPFVELVTGTLFLITTIFILKNSQSPTVNSQSLISLAYYLYIVSSLIVIFFADLKYGIIPDKVVFPAILISIIYLVFNNSYLLFPNFLSAISACLFFLSLFLITKGRGMGFGDVKFAFLMGLILGYPNIIISLYIAFLTGAIIGCILIIWKRKKLFGTSIPFGPFLVAGTFLALFWGADILHLVLNLCGIS
jgi:leader peptidase (prepilin peptidase) / N-methyltransferase